MDVLVFLIRDETSCPREFNMSLLCSFHTEVRTTMIYTHVLNRGGKGYGIQQMRWSKG